MALSAVIGQALVPRKYLSQTRGRFRLEDMVPSRFADWRIDSYNHGGLVNPQTEAMLKRLYSQLLERTYVNSAGDRVMLSVAYGDDQSDVSVQMHYPEVCYPAQGFPGQNQSSGRVAPASGRRLPSAAWKPRWRACVQSQ